MKITTKIAAREYARVHELFDPNVNSNQAYKEGLKVFADIEPYHLMLPYCTIKTLSNAVIKPLVKKKLNK